MSSAIGVLFNPVSGKGRGAKLAQALKLYESATVSIVLEESRKSYEGNFLETFLAPLSALIVVGGDGTLAPLLPALASSGVPVYMLPAGNQSLFSQYFKMSPSLDALAALIRSFGATQPGSAKPRFQEHYWGRANGVPFFTMVSLGLDAEIVNVVSLNRRSHSSNLLYVRHGLPLLPKFKHSKLTIEVDGQPWITKLPGNLVVANTPAYACGIEPVPEANSSEPNLCARFFPDQGIFRYCSWGLSRLFGQSVSLKNTQFESGKHFRILVEGPAQAVQADGEALGQGPVEITIAEKPIRVICPR